VSAASDHRSARAPARNRMPDVAQVPNSPVQLVGDIADFSGETFRGFAHLGQFGSEVLRQAAIIATGSTLIILFTLFLLGSAAGQEVSAVARALGADPIAPDFGCVVASEGITTFIFGFILAAKVGCGMVAEIGSMRVREEVDAVQVMGIRPVTYLIGTRFVGAMVVLPFIYMLSLATSQFGMFINSAIRYGDVSSGTFQLFCFTSIDTRVLLTSFTHGMLMSAGVLLIALYYGWRVSGGPVEVGAATARSMAVNVVFCTATYVVYNLAFGYRTFVPIA
jgi:phospholipid/cholesterol/gamma-HCH transport system permease protein